MNKEQAILISKKIQDALKQIGEEHNLDFVNDSLSYSSSSLSFKISAQERNSKELKEKMTLLSKKFGFTQNIIGMEFTCGNGDFVIQSIKPRNTRYPIIAIRKIDGAVYKFNPKNVLKYIGGNSIVNRVANLDLLLDQK
jgi:hypothetical protein